MRIFKYILILVILSSCERQLDINLPEFEPKLVVNSTFAPNRPMIFYFSESSQILDEPQLQSGIYDGRLIILEDSVLIYDKQASIDSGFLYTTIVPQAGKYYEAYFDIEEYPIVTAKDKVPFMAPSFEMLDIYNLGDKYKVVLRIDDHAHKENYMIQASMSGQEIIGSDTFWAERPVNFSSNDKIFITNITSFRSNSRFALFSDEVLSGSSREISIDIQRSSMPTNFIPKQIVVQISTLSDAYFNYILEIIDNNHVYGGPLATASYDAGNIEGGLGIFGAYIFATDTLGL